MWLCKALMALSASSVVAYFMKQHPAEVNVHILIALSYFLHGLGWHTCSYTCMIDLINYIMLTSCIIYIYISVR